MVALVDGKKKESTKQDAIDFERAWISYVQESGLCNDSIGLLYDGFSITGASPLFSYLSDCENTYDLKNLKKMSLVKENPQGATFRLLVHLLALYMNQGKPCEQILYLVRSIPAFATNKAGSPFGTNFNTIRKYLVRALIPDSVEASLEGLDCHNGDLAKLAAIVSPVLSEMKQNSKETKKGAASVELLDTWLNSANDIQQNMPPVASGEAQEQVASDQTKASFDEAIAVLKSLKRDDEALKGKLASLQSEINAERNASERRKSEIEMRSRFCGTPKFFEFKTL